MTMQRIWVFLGSRTRLGSSFWMAKTQVSFCKGAPITRFSPQKTTSLATARCGRCRYSLQLLRRAFVLDVCVSDPQRYHTLFVTSIVPVPGEQDTFRVWYGAADANVATAVVRVGFTPVQE